MHFYQILGSISLGMLAMIILLTFLALTGSRPKKVVYALSGTVLMLMVAVTVVCAVIYREYGV